MSDNLNHDDRVEPRTDTAALLAFAHAAGTLAVTPDELVEGVVSVFAPDGYTHQLVDLHDQYGPRRRFHQRQVKVTRTDALTAYVARQFDTELGDHAVDASSAVVYVDPNQFRAVAILDDDRRRDHVATLTWQPTPGWLRWSQASGKMFDQTEFAELVEDGIGEILEPAGAVLLDIAQTMRATNTAAFRSARRLDNGETQFAYTEQLETAAGKSGDLKVPAEIVLALTPFHGAEPVKVTARLRYRLVRDKLTLGVILNQPQQVLLDAVDREIDAFRQAHPDVLVVWGTPS